ncbi:MAG: hypothetical protein JWO67_4851 [Streptosporangiaceae bacterium]|nr:hypothetical protein [Streptosporangiaceae bacterium]
MAAPSGELFNPAEDALIDAVATFLGTPLASQATYLPKALAARFEPLGLAVKAVREAGRLALSVPLTGRGAHGSPTVSLMSSTARQVKADEPVMRAQYVLMAAKRLTKALALDVYPQAQRLEENYLKAHRVAGRNRLAAAIALDKVAVSDGPWLVWNTQRDTTVEPDCAALEGRVFTVDNLPNGNDIPGAVHSYCRCYATGFTSGAVVPITFRQGAPHAF